MILSDFLSSEKHGESGPYKIIPISFNMQEMLHVRYYYIHESEQKRYLIQTRSQAKTSSTILPMEHGKNKGLDPNIRPAMQIIKPLVTNVKSHVPTESKDQYYVKPRTGQGRAGIKKKMFRFPILQSCDKLEKTRLYTGRRPIIQIEEMSIFLPL